MDVRRAKGSRELTTGVTRRCLIAPVAPDIESARSGSSAGIGPWGYRRRILRLSHSLEGGSSKIVCITLYGWLENLPGHIGSRSIPVRAARRAGNPDGIPTPLSPQTPVLVYCWASVKNAGPTVNRHRFAIAALRGGGWGGDERTGREVLKANAPSYSNISKQDVWRIDKTHLKKSRFSTILAA